MISRSVNGPAFFSLFFWFGPPIPAARLRSNLFPIQSAFPRCRASTGFGSFFLHVLFFRLLLFFSSQILNKRFSSLKRLWQPQYFLNVGHRISRPLFFSPTICRWQSRLANPSRLEVTFLVCSPGPFLFPDTPLTDGAKIPPFFCKGRPKQSFKLFSSDPLRDSLFPLFDYVRFGWRLEVVIWFLFCFEIRCLRQFQIHIFFLHRHSFPLFSKPDPPPGDMFLSLLLPDVKGLSWALFYLFPHEW